MITFLQIAWSNLLRNRRRTVVTLLAITVGMAMMVFTNGFNAGMSRQWADALINKSEGHLQIHHPDFYKYAVSDMERVLITDPNALIAELRQHPHVVAVLPRISMAGFIGTEENSTTFFGALADLSQIDTVLPDYGAMIVTGQPLTPDDPDGILIGKELAQSIGVQIGDEVVILARTVPGEQGSALAHIRGLLQDGQEDSYVTRDLVLGGISDQMREDLLDINGNVTELIVRVDDIRNVDEVVDWFNQSTTARGDALKAQPWDVKVEYRFLSALFNGISFIVLIILTLIVSFIISNALLMSIFERIREVGSIRAIGTEKRQVYLLFYLEYLLSISIGGGLGLMVGSLLILISGQTGVSISSGIFSGVRPVLELSNLVISFGVPLSVAAVMALFPIRSSCRMSVVESLNYN